MRSRFAIGVLTALLGASAAPVEAIDIVLTYRGPGSVQPWSD